MHSTINAHRRGGSARHTRRATGGEFRALAWLCRHPGVPARPRRDHRRWWCGSGRGRSSGPWSARR